MKPINPKIIYGSVKISGPKTPWGKYLTRNIERFAKDVRTEVEAHIKTLFAGKQHRTNQDIPYPEEIREREIKRRLKEARNENTPNC